MLIEDLIEKAHQANQQLIDSITKDFRDADILAELKNIPKIVSNSLPKTEELIKQKDKLKKTLQSEMFRIRVLIATRIGLIAAKGTNYFEKVQAIELLGNIADGYLALNEYFYPQLKRKPISRWQDDRLRLEQVVCREENISLILKELLIAIKEMAEENCLVPNQCFISYAWSGGKNSEEKWVQSFLSSLRDHLMQAGVYTLLDIKDSLPGGSVFDYMNRVKDSDYVIVVGTELLFQQHKAGVGRICNELVLINQKRVQKEGKTLPILLSGCFENENELPPYFMMYSGITDWRDYSYLENLKKLIADLYGMNLDNPNYQEKWAIFEKKYPSLMGGFPEKAICAQIEREKKLGEQKENLDYQQVMQLFDDMNTRMLSHSQANNISENSLLTWEVLIESVKAKYIQESKFETIFGDRQEISHYYINLAIVEEEKQKEKEKFLTRSTYNQKRKKSEQSNEEKILAKELEREIQLNRYEEIYNAKASILLQDIYKTQDGKILNRQLILGRAGVGKSVLCQYLAYQWAKEEWWKDESFKLLIWIPLRQLTNKSVYLKNNRRISIGKIFYEQYHQQLEQKLSVHNEENEEKYVQELNNLIKKHSAEILYVLDGFDEVADICQLDSREATRQTEILNQLLLQRRVLITSRPYYINNYLNARGIRIDRRLENMGFVDEDIQNYIQRYSKKLINQQMAIQSSLNNNHLRKGIAHIPINLALLCRYWDVQLSKGKDSINMTNLYEGLLKGLLYEYLGKQSGKGNIDFGNLTKDSVLNNKKTQPILQFLEKLAFLQMQEETLIISKERIASLLEEFEDKGRVKNWQGFKSILSTGLIVSPDEQEKRFEERREYYFIHLTFQEFLAARYIACLFKQSDDSSREVALLIRGKLSKRISKQSLVLFMQNYKYDLRYETVWRFVAGLLKAHREGLGRFFNSLHSEPHELSGLYEVLLWIKCLEESKLTFNLNEELKKSLVKEIRKIAQAVLGTEAHISKEQYSKTFFEYVFSSPRVYKELKILKTKEAIKEALNILWWCSNLPPSVLDNIADLLRDKEEEVDVKRLALKTLCYQVNLSSNILNTIVNLLGDRNEGEDIKNLVLDALAHQANLPSDVLSQLNRLDNESTLLPSVLNNVIGLIRDKDVNMRKWALKVLVNRTNLPLDESRELVISLSDEKWENRSLALDALGRQSNLETDVVNEIVNLLDDEQVIVRNSALKALSNQVSLQSSVADKVVSLLSNEDEDVKCSALYALGKQVKLSLNALNKIVNLLNYEDVVVKCSALDALGNQVSLETDVLNNMVSLLRDDEEESVKCSVLNALGKQVKLPQNVLEEIIDLLSCGDKIVENTALNALSLQTDLSPDVLNKILVSITNKKQAYEPNSQEVNFINQQLISILDNPELESRLSSMPTLLSNVILKKAFLSEGVAYFVNEQQLIIKLGQKIKQITIENKNQFMEEFNKQRKNWLTIPPLKGLMKEVLTSSL